MTPRLLVDCLRFFLAVGLLPYGLSKLAGVQFAGGDQYLHKPGATLGGMEMVWAFFAYSRAYQLCAGVLQTTACALLLFRRSAPLGVLLYLATMANVVLVDLCFGVQIQATSWALLLTAGALGWMVAEQLRFRRALQALLGLPVDPPRRAIAERLPRWHGPVALGLAVALFLLLQQLTSVVFP